MAENKSRKRALYIDNITTKDYMLSYMNKHINSDGDFSYIVFTYNINGTVHPWNRHGDIFYNGHKLTYINDVCHNDIITDDHSNYLAYFNENGAFDFAQSYIYVEHNNECIRDVYSLYSVDDPQITVTHWTNFRNFVDFEIKENDGWVYDNINELTFNEIDDNLKISATNADITTSKHFTISYNYHINNIQYSDKYDIDFNVYDTITNVEFVDLPSYFECGQIYTPKLKVEPLTMLSYKGFRYNSINDNIEINNVTGRFVCKIPGESAIKCTYEGGEITSDTIYISKIQNYLSLSSTYTMFIYDSNDINYSYTICYVHAYPENVDTKLSIKFGAQELLTDSPDKYYGIACNNNVPLNIPFKSSGMPGVYTVTVKLDDTIYTHSNATITVTAENEFAETTLLYFTPLAISDDKTMLTGVIVATSQDGEMVNSNYIFNTSGKYDNFIVNDIVYSNNYTYTYISADIINDAESGVIQILTTDGSFITYSTVINQDLL